MRSARPNISGDEHKSDSENFAMADLNNTRKDEAHNPVPTEPLILSKPKDVPITTLAPLKQGLLNLALCLAVFCQALDNTIIATAIPKITDDFNSLDDVGWYGSGYLLSTCAFQLSYGKVYNLYPVKWVFLISLAIFEIGSLICGAGMPRPSLVAQIWCEYYGKLTFIGPYIGRVDYGPHCCRYRVWRHLLRCYTYYRCYCATIQTTYL